MLIPSKQLKVVIADDDSTTCSVLRLLLREHGHQVVAEARDGEKAVELCELHKPDIAFLDIDMPKLNGHQAAQRIRDNTPGVGIIMISALPTLENVQNALQAGASSFVVKPFNAVKVEDAIAQYMRQKQL
ncbi:response regulator transcription factor [Noviherbaspirillum saxi]|uniref:Response regulator n=1 Tax=Noviherbaspirillum saxi TaxID=2320863 RepID=A0A3A3GDI3_9BURK|nr:response regulator [Noviherbaspirillum saxi]RJF98959.1 response regulator [Noviherbaspirillum saxi]